MKGRFLSPLIVEEITCDLEWKLLVELNYESEIIGFVSVPKGFVTDFASVPRLPIVYWLVGGKATKAAVIHDYLYRQSGVSRKEADAVFAEAMGASGQSWWRRRLMYVGLRLFGWAAYQERNPDQLNFDTPEDL